MEERVGQLWHRFITGLAERGHREAAVCLDEMRRPIELMFRAGGGSGATRLTEASAQRHGGPRSLLQRVAGSGLRAELPVLDPDSLALPPQLAVFGEAGLNRDLYLWLAALAAHHEDTGDWLGDNLRASRAALRSFPGFAARHAALCAAQLAARPALARLSGPALAAEQAIQKIIQHTGLHQTHYPNIHATAVAPVWLWLAPGLENRASAPASRPGEAASPPERNPSASGDTDRCRRRAERTEADHDRNGMMMFFRAESLLSWSEHVRVNRQTDDEEDGNAVAAADDMDRLSLDGDGSTVAARVKFDLDLPSAAEDDLPLGEGLALPEWHWKRQRLLPDQCRAQVLQARDPAPFVPNATLARTARRVRRRLELACAQPLRRHAQPQGEELDLDAWVRHASEGGLRRSDAGVWQQRERGARSLAGLLLADLSMSTDAWAGEDGRVIDVIRDALYVFAEALDALGDPFAIWGFSSVRRANVRLQRLKGFDEAHGDAVRARIGAIKPGYYTRMGAALRFATRELQTRGERQRLLLLLTDGKPNDLDVYEGRYGLEDTRQAVREARAAGLVPFCVTIDAEAGDYLPHLFGNRGYALVRRPAELVTRLAQCYAQLAGAGR